MKSYNLVYHYNHYTKTWACIPREEYHGYFNGTSVTCGGGTTIEDAYINWQDKILKQAPPHHEGCECFFCNLDNNDD